MDEHFDLPNAGDIKTELYGLKLDAYDGQRIDMWVFDGPKRLELTREEITDVWREYSERNPKGVYSICEV